MSKIGILTMYYSNISHGGLLQAYSLCSAIKRMGFSSVEQITYDYNMRFRQKTLLEKIKHAIYKTPYKLLCVVKKDHSKEKYYSYMDEVPHSQYYSPDTIKESRNKYDYFIVGSDQVWNMDYCDENFYLIFARDKKRIAYAASIGKDNLTSEKVNELIDNIKDFNSISVRENELKEIIANNSDIACECVCDPVFLNDASFWRKHAKYSANDGKYTLIYILGDTIEEKEKAYNLARRIGLPAITIPNVNLNMKLRDMKYSDTEKYSIGPKEFLGLIDNAEYILTDSFHCTAFSILFNKKFYAFNRPNKEFTMNSRLFTLLEKIGLQNRFIDLNDNSFEIQEIDYYEPNLRIKTYSEQSLNWLQKALNN